MPHTRMLLASAITLLGLACQQGSNTAADGAALPGDAAAEPRPRDGHADEAAPPDSAPDGSSKPAYQPNIVFIMLDDAGSADYGDAPYTDPSIVQPNLKLLAAQSVRFEQYYTAPMCTPTRMSQLTGQYPMRYGILWVCGSNAEYGIPATHATLPQTLKAAGYHTATFGKWHSGQGKPAYAADRKFDRSVVSFGVVGNGYADPRYTIDGSATPTAHPGEHLTDVTAAYVVKHIKQRAAAGTPFFVNYWLNAPHSPHQPARRWEQRYCGAKTGAACAVPLRYKALLSQADENIGKVLDAIDAVPGLREKTIVLLTSDNGGTPLTHPNGNGPLRGFKTDVFEGGTRLPLYVRWPGIIAPGTVDRSLLGVQDIFPTLVELAGAPAPQGIAGKSFAAVLRGEERDRDRGEPMFWSHKVANEHVATTRGHVLVSHAVRDGRWKLVYEPLDRAEAYLFDLLAHDSEADEHDLAAAHPERVSDLQQQYLRWLLSTARVPVVVDSTDGSVAVAGDTLTFSAPAGSAQLRQQQAFNITRLDFTFAARIRSTAPGTVRTVAALPGAWNLRLDAAGHLVLNATDAKGNTTSVVGSTALAANKVYDVAFTVFAFKSLDSVARIYLREAAASGAFGVEADREIPPFGSNDNTITVGAGGKGLTPFLGTIGSINIFRAPLTRPQLREALGS